MTEEVQSGNNFEAREPSAAEPPTESMSESPVTPAPEPTPEPKPETPPTPSTPEAQPESAVKPPILELPTEEKTELQPSKQSSIKPPAIEQPTTEKLVIEQPPIEQSPKESSGGESTEQTPQPVEEKIPSTQPTAPIEQIPTSSPAASPLVATPQPPIIGKIFAIIKEKIFVRREKRLQKILDYLNQKGRITNAQARKILRVSEATATRYLDILERRSKIKQVGKTGKGVTYELLTQ